MMYTSVASHSIYLISLVPEYSYSNTELKLQFHTSY